MRRCAWLRMLLFLIVPALLPAGPAAARGAGPVEIGRPAPLFTLPDLQGRPISLASLRGRPVVLHFWATWCPACREEMPVLERAARERPRDVRVIGINLSEKPRDVAAFVKEHGLTFPILLDARGKVAARYGVLSLPITLFVGPDGVVADVVAMGGLTTSSLEERLRRMPPRL